MKPTYPFPVSPRFPSDRKRVGLQPRAFRFLLTGQFFILIALCEFILRFQKGSSVEHLLYIEPFMESVAASLLILWSIGLGMDYSERTKKRRGPFP